MPNKKRPQAQGVIMKSTNSIPITSVPSICNKVICDAIAKSGLSNLPANIGPINTYEYIAVIASHIHRPLLQYAKFLKKHKKAFSIANAELCENLKLHGNLCSMELLSEIETVVQRIDEEIAKYGTTDLTFAQRAISELGGLYEQLGGTPTANHTMKNNGPVVDGPFVRFVETLSVGSVTGQMIYDYKRKLKRQGK